MSQLEPKGTTEEQKLFIRVRDHYDRSKNDLQTRIADFDKKDELFRTHINTEKWPYRAQAADPSTFTFIIEKTSRLISNKLRGRVEPREGSDWLKAKIANELLDYQWDLASQGGSMIQKWALMDMNARKYGASFGICKWRYERKKGSTKYSCNNPEFEVINNRDVLVNPDYSEIKDWFQYRTYITLSELKAVNETAASEPKYKNLDILQDSIDKQASEKGDRRDTNYVSRNKTIKGLNDTLGDDKYTKYIEVVKEYTPDKIVWFAPNHGVILREEENPWGEIPAILLKYYMIDDDIYGLSEIEPIEKLQRVENALISQYLDTVNNDLYPPLLVNTSLTQLHTLEFGPNKKWLVQDVNNAVKRFDTSTAATGQFQSTITFILSRMANAVGETSQGVSNIDPTSQDKTATEVKDSAIQRLSRDNFNQIFLAEALKKQMLLWLKMDAKLMTKNQMIRILGKESLAFFKKNMMTPGPIDPMTGQPGELTPYGPSELSTIDETIETPVYPVEENGELVPKFQMDPTGQAGEMIIEPSDLAGIFDYIPDVESMSIQKTDDSKLKMLTLQLLTGNPVVLQLLQAEGVKPRIQDLLVEMLEDSGFKDADRFFESAPQQSPMMGQGGIDGSQGQELQAIGAGTAGPQGGLPPQGNVQQQGMGAGIQTNAGGQAGPIVPGSVAGY